MNLHATTADNTPGLRLLHTYAVEGATFALFAYDTADYFAREPEETRVLVARNRVGGHWVVVDSETGVQESPLGWTLEDALQNLAWDVADAARRMAKLTEQPW